MDINMTNPNGVNLKTANKYCEENIYVIPVLEDVTVTPTTSAQIKTPSTGKAGISKVTVSAIQTETTVVTPAKGAQTVQPTSGKYFLQVTVEAIPDDYVIPSGTQQITANGTYDVSGKESAVVNVPTTISAIEEVSTAAEMNALLVAANVGKAYKFTGTTDSTYTNGYIYEVVQESGSVKYNVYAPYQLPQLATPQNVSAIGTTVSWNAVENATSYEIFADGTSLATTANVSYNLTNSAGWANLSDGNHNITIVAKADGYRDSERSSAVVVTKSTTPTEDELAGTWVFNETLNLSAGPLPEEVIAELGWVDIPITADDGTEYSGLLFGSLNGELNEFTSLLYGGTEVYNGVWGKESDRIITINALLEEVKNGQSLLEFLQANAIKQGAATLISFSIDRSSIGSDTISYQAEDGMTWAQWVNSSYNTGGYMDTGTWIADQFGNSVAIRSGKFLTHVSPSDTIQASTVYVLKASTGGGGK